MFANPVRLQRSVFASPWTRSLQRCSSAWVYRHFDKPAWCYTWVAIRAVIGLLNISEDREAWLATEFNLLIWKLSCTLDIAIDELAWSNEDCDNEWCICGCGVMGTWYIPLSINTDVGVALPNTYGDGVTLRCELTIEGALEPARDLCGGG